jgi:hypothetical protein
MYIYMYVVLFSDAFDSFLERRIELANTCTQSVLATTLVKFHAFYVTMLLNFPSLDSAVPRAKIMKRFLCMFFFLYPERALPHVHGKTLALAHHDDSACRCT